MISLSWVEFFFYVSYCFLLFFLLGLVLCGGLTGAICWTVAFPVDVVKSLCQADMSPTRVNWWTVAMNHWKKEGMKGYWKGWRAAVIRSFPTHGTTLATYTILMKQLG